MKILIVFCFVFIPLSLAIFHPFSNQIRHHRRNLEDENLSEDYSNSIKHDRGIITGELFDYHTLVRDFVQFANDTNGKIARKIIDELKKIPSNFKNLRKPIILSADGYSFPKPVMKFHSDEKDVLVVFHNVTLSQFFNSDHDRKRFSTLVGCDSSTISKIKIELPFNLQIVANLSVIQSTTGSMREGFITLVIRNATIWKDITTSADNEFEETFRKISFTDSKIDIQSDAAPEILLDIKLGAFFKEIEISLRQFFANQLNEEVNKRNVELAAICLKTGYNPNDQNQAITLHPLSLILHSILNLYIIPSSTTETWKGTTLNLEPIVMSELLHFDSFELLVSREYDYNENKYQKQLSSRIKITNLKGKFECNLSHNNITGSSSGFFSFTSDYILLDNNYSFVDDWRANWNQDIKVYVGTTQIIRKHSKSNTSDRYEKQFMDYVLSEHLKSVISASLERSLKEKMYETDFSFVESFFNDD